MNPAAWTVRLHIQADQADGASGWIWAWGADGVQESAAPLLFENNEGPLLSGHPDDVAPPPPILDPAEPVLLTATFLNKAAAQSCAQKLAVRYGEAAILGPDPVESADWQERWKEGFVCLEVGTGLRIVPAWLDAPDTTRIPIRIDPGMAFGTGTHETTGLMLRRLETLLHPGDSVLDLGTGTGILAFGAALLGAGPVQGVEPDKAALANALANRSRNNLDSRVDLVAGDCSTATGTWTLVLANILAPILIEWAAAITARVAPGGTLLVSGLLDQHVAPVSAAFEAHGLHQQRVEADNDWRLIEFR